MFEKKAKTSNISKFLFDCGILETDQFLNIHYSLLSSEASRTSDCPMQEHQKETASDTNGSLPTGGDGGTQALT